MAHLHFDFKASSPLEEGLRVKKQTLKWNCPEIPDSSKPSRKKRAPKVDTFIIGGVDLRDNCVSIALPLKTISEANRIEHWTLRSERRRAQKLIICAGLSPYLALIKLPCQITFHRFGPKLLDLHDNLPLSFKGIVDYVAELITGKGKGRGDSDPRLSWKYSQEKSSSYGIKITFEF